jgi:hypothetical protein
MCISPSVSGILGPSWHTWQMDIRYPIGQFTWTGPNTPQQRAAAIDDIAAVPQKMRSAVEGLNEAQPNTPYREGGWTVKRVVHHVPDSHMNSYIRFKFALTEQFSVGASYRF